MDPIVYLARADCAGKVVDFPDFWLSVLRFWLSPLADGHNTILFVFRAPRVDAQQRLDFHVGLLEALST